MRCKGFSSTNHFLMLDQILVAFMCSWVFSYYSPLTIPLQISKRNGVPLWFSKGACWWITTENSHLWDSQSISMESFIHFCRIWYIYNHIITIQKYHKNLNFCMVLKRTHNGPQLRKLIFFFMNDYMPWKGCSLSLSLSKHECCTLKLSYLEGERLPPPACQTLFSDLSTLLYLLFAVIIYSKVSYMVASNSLH